MAEGTQKTKLDRAAIEKLRLTPDELREAGAAIAELIAEQNAVDLDTIRPGMTDEDRQKAWDAVRRAGDRQ